MPHDLSELTTHCIRCGFCLEACPTFTQTGSELESPRGRIYLVRSAIEGAIQWEDAREHLDRCLGCRACETACPSGVQYGQILEMARDRLEHEHPNRAREALIQVTTTPAALKANLLMGRLWPGGRIPGFVSRLVSGQAPEVDKPIAQRLADYPPLNGELSQVHGEIFVLKGCAMDVLFGRVQQATTRLLRRVGYVARDGNQGCCGAMHAHNGFLDKANEYAEKLAISFAGDLPIVVNSAGCGSTMKEYADRQFATRVRDLSEFLLEKGLVDRLAEAPGLPGEVVTYHDACHLAHGQGIRSQPRELIRAIPGIKFVELDEADTCCGSAGIYNVTQPKLARELLTRKWNHIESTGATIVATGNPGCHAWIEQAAREHGRRVRVVHTAELLEAAFSGTQYLGVGSV